MVQTVSGVRLDTIMSAPEVGFQSVYTTLRPRRVAIVMRNDEHWRDWAMTALQTASGYWGGAGFIVVPFDPLTGVVSDAFADVVRAYDPDHVVALSIPVTSWEAWYPGTVKINRASDDADRARMIATSPPFCFVDPAAKAPREQVASWCSPMRLERPGRQGERALEAISALEARHGDDQRYGGMPPAPFASPGSRLAADLRWRSDVGLFAALRLGVAATETIERSEPTPDALNWLVHGGDEPPVSFIWSNEVITPTNAKGLEPLFTGEQGLMRIGRGYLEDRSALVIGDTAEDFALALAYDRMIGGGLWLTPTQLDDPATFRKVIQPVIWTIIHELEQSGAHMVVTSTSVTEDYLATVAKRIQDDVYVSVLGGDGHQIQDAPGRATITVRTPNLQRGLLTYVVDEHVGASLSLPISKLPDGSIEALSGLETPVPSNLLYDANSSWVPYWLVDVTLEGDATPSGRGLPGNHLVSPKNSFPAVNVRSGKDGLSFDPRSMGFVPAGALLTSRIDRPLIRGLSMRSWVEAMANTEGLGVRLSAPGRQAELIRSRYGTRQQLLDLVSGGKLSMLRAFVRRDKQPKADERDPETVVLGLDPFLSFNGIAQLLDGSREAATDVVDDLVSTRLLRRGLVLNCAECGRPSFVDADRLGQQFECSQCATMNPLVSARWHQKTSEPTWFYDLYAAFRELLASRGDIVLLAASNLQDNIRTYADTPELEFYELDTGKAVAEIDVIASVDGKVVIVEAKAGGTFGPRKRGIQTAKLLRIASVLRADRIQLATTQGHWNQADVEHLRKLAAEAKPFPISVDVATSLG